MNEIIIQNHNELVKPEDEVWMLGDCTLGDIESGIRAMKRLNGKKHLIIGNHDSKSKIDRYMAEGIFEDAQYATLLKFNKHFSFYLSHYPTITANMEAPNVPWNLHGHTHQTYNFPADNGRNKMDTRDKNFKMYHVGMDSHDCKPISLEKIQKDIINNMR